MGRGIQPGGGGGGGGPGKLSLRLRAVGWGSGLVALPLRDAELRSAWERSGRMARARVK
jgi:hypothetical protein